MQIEPLKLEGAFLIKPTCYYDERGYFFESWKKDSYQKMGIDVEFVQDNVSFSKKGVIRGLHYQRAPGQAKLVSAIEGTIWDVIVDLRKESPTYKKWVGVFLSDDNHFQLYVPIGFAHGYCIISDTARVSYKVSSVYDANEERTIAWNDPSIGIDWPIKEPILSCRDSQGAVV